MKRSPTMDMFRGFNIIQMEIAETFDDLDHAKYNEMKLNWADTIFPCFSFISGMLLKQDKIIPLNKNIQLIGLGMTFNLIPTILENKKFRPLGVLQRHGLSSILLNNLIPPNYRNKIIFPIALTTIWSLISKYLANNTDKPFENEIYTAQQKIDSIFFKGRQYHDNFDPEGLLGALMTTVTIWLGSWFISQNFNYKIIPFIGFSFILFGRLLSNAFPNMYPVSKPLWTPSFTLQTTGYSILNYCISNWLCLILPTSISNSIQLMGQYSLENYFFGELLLVGLKESYVRSSGVTLWDKIKSFFKFKFPFTNIDMSPYIMTSIFNVVLLGFTHLCHWSHFKIRLF